MAETANKSTLTDEERFALVYRAKLVEQSERYDDMVKVMTELTKAAAELTVEERNLLSVAFKNAVGTRRAAWRIVSNVEQREIKKNESCGENAAPNGTDNVKLCQAYRGKIESELKTICNDILELLEKYLIKSAPTTEGQVFYYKMQGDYYRYLAEIASDAERKETAEKAEMAYQSATELSAKELLSTHPIRLGLALNFSVFYYEIMSQPTKACQLAKKAFDDAIGELDTVNEECYKDSTLIMQLLRDNLTLWTSDNVESAAKEEVKE